MATIAVCLIYQYNFLIDQQLRRLEKDFLEQGGLRERMTRLRPRNRMGGEEVALGQEASGSAAMEPAYFLEARSLAHLAFAAAEMRARPAADILL